MTPSLILGPLLRYVDATEATVWVQTDTPCEVTVIGHSARTFTIGANHYGLVTIGGLDPGSSTPYDVRLDGSVAWPPADGPLPASRIQTHPISGPRLIGFGSCRVAKPDEPPYTLSPDEDPRGVGPDALRALALRLIDTSPDAWPRLLLLLGDQIYADEISPRTLDRIRARRDTARPPGEEVADFTEYTWLYHDAWSPELIRWLLSTVPTAMIFDDHDIRDDWNISASWLAEMRARPWWQDRIAGGLAAYWVYQHIGNLAPSELRADPVFRQVCAAEDGTEILRDFVLRANATPGGGAWSYARRLGDTRLVVIDSREGRILEPGRRAMLDEPQWAWLAGEVGGGADHILLAGTLPVLLSPALHEVEGLSEAVCDGVWGRPAARVAERVRRILDLEHWPSFQRSFHRLFALVDELSDGRHGPPPASITLLGGDVHHSYVDEIRFRNRPARATAIHQAVVSPFRNQLGRRYRRALRFARRSRILHVLTRTAARLAGVGAPEITWRTLQEPSFANGIGWIAVDGRTLTLTLERAGPRGELEVVFERRLAPARA